MRKIDQNRMCDKFDQSQNFYAVLCDLCADLCVLCGFCIF